MKKRQPNKKTVSKISIAEIIKKEKLFTEVKEVAVDESKEIVSFSFAKSNITAEIHFANNFSLFRMTNLFNFEKTMSAHEKDFNMLHEANEFNRRSVGIKCCIKSEDKEKKAYFRIEAVIPQGNYSFVSAEMLLINSSILSGAPALFVNNIK